MMTGMEARMGGRAGMKKKHIAGQLGFTFESADGAKSTAVAVAKKQHPKKTPPKIAKQSGKTKSKKEKIVEESTAAETPPVEAVELTVEAEAIEAKARDMASRQREISVSEFFAKNRHLLGFDNPRKALLTSIKEAVDNSLDACEEAQILPDLEVGIQETAEDRFRIWVQDNGPGIVKNQIPNIFGRLLYGSKFHTPKMSRGQQGIGISAAGMYGLLTTGKSVKINSRTGPRSQAHHYELQINTKKNRPEIIADAPIDWDAASGTRVEMEIEARYQKGRQSVDEYLAQTAITNPHARIRYLPPDGQEIIFERSVTEAVEVPRAVKPHPYGVELGVLMKMAKDTVVTTLAAFLCHEFSRVSLRISQQILDKAQLKSRTNPHTITNVEVEKLHKAINATKIMAPSTSCIVPIGQEALLKGLQQVVKADFYTSCTRPPAVYRGNPFQIEVALAYGGNGFKADPDEEEKKKTDNAEPELMRVLRFANRVPLLYQQSACAIFKSIMQTNWRLYGLSQSKGALPSGPVTVIVHIASVWVPFTSESKEAVAHYPEILKEIRLALSEVGRNLGRYLRGQRRQRDEALKRGYIEKYLPAIGEALRDILTLKDPQVKSLLINLEKVLDTTRRTEKSATEESNEK
jgi:DNA topoisomerase VI subunit B